MVRSQGRRGIVLREVIALALSSSGTALHRRPSGRGSLSRLAVLTAWLLTITVVVAACAPATEMAPSIALPSSAGASSAPSPSQPVPETAPDMQACTPDVAEAAFDVVQRQQSAFADDDFAAALRLASTEFQSSVTLSQFKALIASGYSFLLASEQLRMTECVTEGTTALLRVGVSSDSVLAYRMVVEDGEWRIDGASILKEISA